MANAKCYFAAVLKMDRDRSCALHTHACTEIVYCDGCSGYFPHEDRHFPYADGSILVYQPPERHGNFTKTPGFHICVGVEGCGADRIPVGIWQADSAVKDVFDRIRTELAHPSPRHLDKLDLFAGWLALEVGRLARGEQSQKGPPGSVHVDAAKAIFDARFKEPLTIRDVAESLSIHPDYLRQMFKQQLGESPMHYLIRKRLDCACELLKISELSIKEIGDQVGLENPYYFSRLFKSRMKTSPSVYRTRHRTKVGGSLKSQI